MTAAPVKNMQDPRVIRTRQLLQQAFASILIEKGFESITVRDIAERATVNRATFYAHYRDKYDLAYNLAQDQFRQHLDADLPSTSAVSAETLETLCLSVFAFLTDVYGHCNLDRQFGPLLEGAMLEELHAFITDWLTQGLELSIARRVALDTTSLTVSSALIVVGLRWSRGERKQTANQMARQIVAVLTMGMLAVFDDDDMRQTKKT